jgi:hypothetical protein
MTGAKVRDRHQREDDGTVREALPGTMRRTHHRSLEALLIVGLALYARGRPSVAPEPQTARIAGHTVSTRSEGDSQSLPARGAQTVTHAGDGAPASEADPCASMDGAPGALTAFVERARERALQVGRLAHRGHSGLPRVYRRLRALALDPTRDGADGTIELWVAPFAYPPRWSPGRSAWVFDEIVLGVGCSSRPAVLRWMTPDGAIGDQWGLDGGAIDARVTDLPSGLVRSIEIEQDNCGVTGLVAGTSTLLVTIRDGRLLPRTAVDEHGRRVALELERTAFRNWTAAARPTSAHSAELLSWRSHLHVSSRGPEHNRCIDAYTRSAWDGRCYRSRTALERRSGSIGAETHTECTTPSLDESAFARRFPAPFSAGADASSLAPFLGCSG